MIYEKLTLDYSFFKYQLLNRDYHRPQETGNSAESKSSLPVFGQIHQNINASTDDLAVNFL